MIKILFTSLSWQYCVTVFLRTVEKNSSYLTSTCPVSCNRIHYCTRAKYHQKWMPNPLTLNTFWTSNMASNSWGRAFCPHKYSSMPIFCPHMYTHTHSLTHTHTLGEVILLQWLRNFFWHVPFRGQKSPSTIVVTSKRE